MNTHGRLGDKVSEARLRWFERVKRRDSEYRGRRMIKIGYIIEEDTEDTVRWI